MWLCPMLLIMFLFVVSSLSCLLRASRRRRRRRLQRAASGASRAGRRAKERRRRRRRNETIHLSVSLLLSFQLARRRLCSLARATTATTEAAACERRGSDAGSPFTWAIRTADGHQHDCDRIKSNSSAAGRPAKRVGGPKEALLSWRGGARRALSTKFLSMGFH